MKFVFGHCEIRQRAFCSEIVGESSWKEFGEIMENDEERISD